MPARDPLNRVRALAPTQLDLLVGVVLGIEMQAEAFLVEEHELATRGVLLLLATAFAMRRRRPMLAFVVAMVPFVAVQALGQAVTDNLFLPLFLCIFMCYSVAAHSDSRWWWVAAPIAYGSGLLAIGLDDYEESSVAADFLWLALIFVAAPMVTGRLLRNRSRLQLALREKAERMEREREQAAEHAAIDERTRIAGDLHDIVAHALTEITVQASAAGRLAGRDPERARVAFEAVEERGRDALGELRRLLGVLRHADEEIALAPQPSLRHIEALAHRARAAGLPVDVTVEGAAAELPAGIDVTGYRVVQEALNQALRDHGAGHADVVVRYAPTAVELEVADDGYALGDDPALGLRERVKLYGGELSSGRRSEGGHVVRARLPREVRG